MPALASAGHSPAVGGPALLRGVLELRQQVEHATPAVRGQVASDGGRAQTASASWASWVAWGSMGRPAAVRSMSARGYFASARKIR